MYIHHFLNHILTPLIWTDIVFTSCAVRYIKMCYK